MLTQINLNVLINVKIKFGMIKMAFMDDFALRI